MADDGKRTENICFKATERVALDLNRACAAEDRKLSEYIYMLVRRELYGRSLGLTRDGDDRQD